MALGLNSFKSAQVRELPGIRLLDLINNPVGFPVNYLPKIRVVDGITYINTISKGKDENDNSIVFYKWIIINPTDLSATEDSDSEFARLPESGCIMRIKQRSLLPYHENFEIDYYEDINSVKVVEVKNENRQEFSNKMNNVYRTFRLGDIGVPSDLKKEIYTYPEAFFKKYIEGAIPLDSLYRGNSRESNHISSYAPIGNGIDIMPVNAYQNPTMPSDPYGRSVGLQQASSHAPSMRTSDIQSRINQQIIGQGASMGQSSSGNRPKTIEETGFRYKIF